MPQDTGISLRTGSLELRKLTSLFSWSQQTKVVSKPPFKRVTTRREKFKDKLVSTPVCCIFLVSNKSSLVSTRWTPRSLSHTAKTDTRRSTRKSRKCLLRLDSRRRKSLSFPCLDSRETT